MQSNSNHIPVLTFFNNKGGVGKTTMVYHLSYMLGELGKRVLVVDLDPQSNLSSMFLNDEIEKFWVNDNESTILTAIRPLIRGLGDIEQAFIKNINERIGLVVGDLGLSSFEDKLSDAWIRCSDGDEAAFRIVSAFFRIIQTTALSHKASIVLVDVGPNLGAINRSALISSDYIITPVAPDLYSVQGLKNLGPTLINWRRMWENRLQQRPDDPSLILPKGNMLPKGYIVLQHGVRNNRPVKAYQRWANKIPIEYRNSVIAQNNNGSILTIENDEYCLGLLKHYQSLMPMSMEARKPIFLLKPSDGAIGAHYQAVQRSYLDLEKLAKKILEVTLNESSEIVGIDR
ncbi:MAG: AAA family ATPase [Bacteroidota bacterium]